MTPAQYEAEFARLRRVSDEHVRLFDDPRPSPAAQGEAGSADCEGEMSERNCSEDGSSVVVTNTSRGFCVFGAPVPSHGGGSVRVVESSLAFEGPHVRVFFDGKPFADADPHLNVEGARALAAALIRFANMAEAGNLTEKCDG